MTAIPPPPLRRRPAAPDHAPDRVAAAAGGPAGLHCAAAAALFLALLAGVAACGNGDLVFPGDVPATNTPVNTATPEPDEDDDI